MRALERQPGETVQAWRGFQCYRDLGPTRSIDKAYRIYTGQQESGKRASGRFTKWSRQHDWVARAETWDAYHEMIRREAVAEYERNAGAEMAYRLEKVQEELISAKERLVEKVQIMASWPLERTVIQQVEESDDGKVVHKTVHVFPARWSFHTLIRAIEVLDETPNKVDLRHIDFDALTDEQLERIANGEDPLRVIREHRKEEDGY